MKWLAQTAEGPDATPAHFEAASTAAVSLSIPVTDTRLALGNCQVIYRFEHRDRERARRVRGHLCR